MTNKHFIGEQKLWNFLLIHIENETFVINQIDFFFQNIFRRFRCLSEALVTHRVVRSSG